MTVADAAGVEIFTLFGVTLDSETVKEWSPSRTLSSMIVILVHAVSPVLVFPTPNVASKLAPLKSSPSTEEKRVECLMLS